MPQQLDAHPSVFPIRCSDGKKNGTGFAVWSEGNALWLVTCAHVVTEIEVGQHWEVEGKEAKVLFNGRSEERKDKVDLALLKVDDLTVHQTLRLAPLDYSPPQCEILGWYNYYFPLFKRKDLTARLAYKPHSGYEGGSLWINLWDVEVTDDGQLEKGFSGAPVICRSTGCVVGVVNIRIEQSCKIGTAICISHLADIWPDMPEGLRKSLETGSIGSDYAPLVREIFGWLHNGLTTREIRACCKQSSAGGSLPDWPDQDSLLAYCDWLLDLKPLGNHRHPLYDVLCHIESKLDDTQLPRLKRAKQLLEKQHPGLITAQPPPFPKPPAEKASSMEIVFEPRESPEHKGFDVKVRWCPSAGESQAICVREVADGGRSNPDNSRIIPDNKRQLGGFIEKLLHQLGQLHLDADPVVFRFRLPVELLLHSPEDWPQDATQEALPLGYDYPVVLTNRDERKPDLHRQKGAKVSNQFENTLMEVGLGLVASAHDVLERMELPALLNKIDPSACSTLQQVPNVGVSPSLLKFLLGRGVCIAFWPRGKEAERGIASLLRDKLGDTRLKDLPFELHELRKGSFAEGDSIMEEDSTIRQLSLLWDMPDPPSPRQFLSGMG